MNENLLLKSYDSQGKYAGDIDQHNKLVRDGCLEQAAIFRDSLYKRISLCTDFSGSNGCPPGDALELDAWHLSNEIERVEFELSQK